MSQINLYNARVIGILMAGAVDSVSLPHANVYRALKIRTCVLRQFWLR